MSRYRYVSKMYQYEYMYQYQRSKHELSNLLLKKYTKVLETGELSDMEIVIGDEPNTKTYRLHSFILKVYSSKFYAALTKNRVKTENDITKYQKRNISVEIFEII